MEVKSWCSERKEVILAQVVMGGQRSDFHVVDLEAGEVLKTGIESLLNEGGYGNVVNLGPVIYDIGGLTSVERPINPSLLYGDYRIHLGASCLELNIPHFHSQQRGADDDNDDDALKLGSNKWKDIPPMTFIRLCPCCTSLGGKVYALGQSSGYALGGSSAETCIGEVFDPWLGRWESLPPPPSNISLDSLTVSTPVLSDEKNDRLLVHFDDANSVYAYYPDIGRWECLVHDFRLWLPAATLADDVLYFHITVTYDFLIAFDLLSKARLKVNYSDSSKFPFRVYSNAWDGMLHLGNGMLCLANYCPFGEPVQTNLHFVKFRVQRTSSEEVLVTFDSANSFPFKGRFRANRFILL